MGALTPWLSGASSSPRLGAGSEFRAARGLTSLQHCPKLAVQQTVNIIFVGVPTRSWPSSKELKQRPGDRRLP
jgi:hypothetical protein